MPIPRGSEHLQHILKACVQIQFIFLALMATRDSCFAGALGGNGMAMPMGGWVFTKLKR